MKCVLLKRTSEQYALSRTKRRKCVDILIVRYSIVCFIVNLSFNFVDCSAAVLNPTNAGMQAPLGTVGTSQTSAPNISSTTNIDPSSMQRAYAALGLPYGNQSPTQMQAQIMGQQIPVTQPHQQQLRPTSSNSLGNVQICAEMIIIFLIYVWACYGNVIWTFMKYKLCILFLLWPNIK